MEGKMIITLNVSAITEQAFNIFKRKYVQKNGEISFDNLIEKGVEKILLDEIKKLNINDDEDILNQFVSSRKYRKIVEEGVTDKKTQLSKAGEKNERKSTK